MARGIAGLIALSLIVTAHAISGKSQPSRAGVPNSYSDDAHGLEKQFEPLLKAYAKGDPVSINKAYAVFGVPEPSKWFAGYFAAGDVQQLVWNYESEVDGYKKSLFMMMKIVRTTSRFHAHCSPPDSDHQTQLQARVGAVQPTLEVPVEQFRVEFVADDGKKFSQLCNFVYLDGAFRYLGKGAYPFWSMPDTNRK
jgi:hypothetical protein